MAKEQQNNRTIQYSTERKPDTIKFTMAESFFNIFWDNRTIQYSTERKPDTIKFTMAESFFNLFWDNRTIHVSWTRTIVIDSMQVTFPMNIHIPMLQVWRESREIKADGKLKENGNTDEHHIMAEEMILTPQHSSWT